MEDLNKFWKNKKVFITGHTGFKGTWLSIVLNHLDAKISGYSLKPLKNSLFVKSKIEKDLFSNTYSDIRNLSKLQKKIKSFKPQVIFHLAAQPLVLESYKDPIDTFEININGTINLLQSIRKIKSVKSVVIITTDKVYKINKKNNTYKEEDELGGFDPYSASKTSSEIILNSYIQSFFKSTQLDSKISSARSGNVIGGGDFSKNRLVPDILNSINKKKKLTIRNPDQIRPWQHVLEPLVGYLILAEKQYKYDINKKNHSWNFGPNYKNSKRVIDIVNLIKKTYNFKYTIKRNDRYKETDFLKLNSIKAQEKLKWTGRWNLDYTLQKTLEWNGLVKEGKSAKDVCVNQFLEYINK
jgi:CDP-glucose 4,6-dehydratase